MEKSKNFLEINAIQFFILGLLTLIILADKLPVIIDGITNTPNYRLTDGWGDGMKDFCFLIITVITLATMKFKKNKADFIAVLAFVICFMLCISSQGFFKFLAETIFSLIMLIYIINSFISKSNQQKTFNKNNNP